MAGRVRGEDERANVPEPLGHWLLLPQLLVQVPPRVWALLKGVGRPREL